MNRTLRIRTQLALLCAVFIVMLASLGGLGLWRAKLNSDAMQSMYVDRVVPLQQLKTISDMYAVNMVDTAHKFADGAMTPVQATDALQQARQSIDKEWSAYLATYLVPEEVKLADRLKPLMAAADATVPRLMEMIRADDRAGVAAFRAQTMYPVFDPMQGVIGDLIALQLDVSRQMFENSQAGVQTLVWIMVAATLASALVGGAISAWIIWRLTHQLGAEPHEVRALADAIASGDLTQRIMVPSGDGSSVMAAMKRMNEHLVSVVAGVRQNADSVSNASREIAQGNHDLSQRSEEQASALEQTAASMEQMTANVGSNTEHAVQASHLARSAAQGVQKGGESVGQVLESMRSIDAASNRIMEIVSMIDGIAFQT
ncbi:MAG: MCP four helix bundle domain-containing protein, partial [Hydrogenophaga sp.]|nr:MCP four helix bundle domain-containing protein [Hydrogenophaga sp.]